MRFVSDSPSSSLVSAVAKAYLAQQDPDRADGVGDPAPDGVLGVARHEDPPAAPRTCSPTLRRLGVGCKDWSKALATPALDDRRRRATARSTGRRPTATPMSRRRGARRAHCSACGRPPRAAGELVTEGISGSDLTDALRRHARDERRGDRPAAARPHRHDVVDRAQARAADVPRRTGLDADGELDVALAATRPRRPDPRRPAPRAGADGAPTMTNIDERCCSVPGREGALRAAGAGRRVVHRRLDPPALPGRSRHGRGRRARHATGDDPGGVRRDALDNDRTLVVVFLRGAADGLRILVPELRRPRAGLPAQVRGDLVPATAASSRCRAPPAGRSTPRCSRSTTGCGRPASSRSCPRVSLPGHQPQPLPGPAVP